MGHCNCDMTKYIRKQKNIYYIDYTIPMDAAVSTPSPNEFYIGFPQGGQNIKANNALVSVDKFCLRGQSIENTKAYPLMLQTAIPTSNVFSAQIQSSQIEAATSNFQDPRNTGYSELIVLEPHTIATGNGGFTDHISIIATYKNNNPDRKILCQNPMGKQFSCRFFAADETSGIREADSALTGNVCFTLRIELLEEEIIK